MRAKCSLVDSARIVDKLGNERTVISGFTTIADALIEQSRQRNPQLSEFRASDRPTGHYSTPGVYRSPDRTEGEEQKRYEVYSRRVESCTLGEPNWEVKVTGPAGTVITENAATMADTPDPNLTNNTVTVSLKVQ